MVILCQQITLQCKAHSADIFGNYRGGMQSYLYPFYKTRKSAMRNKGLAASIIWGTLIGIGHGDVEPSSIKMSGSMKGIETCDGSMTCESVAQSNYTGSQTFDLPETLSNQFGSMTAISIQGNLLYSVSVRFDLDPNYEPGDDSVSISFNEVLPDITMTGKIKASWKNGICKVSIKSKATGEGLLNPTIAALGTQAALEPGNPQNTGSMSVTFYGLMNIIEESRGYFAYKAAESLTQKPTGENGLQSTFKISMKSQAQVGEPLIK